MCSVSVNQSFAEFQWKTRRVDTSPPVSDNFVSVVGGVDHRHHGSSVLGRTAGGTHGHRVSRSSEGSSVGICIKGENNSRVRGCHADDVTLRKEFVFEIRVEGVVVVVLASDGVASLV